MALAFAGCGDNRVGRALDRALPNPREFVYGAIVADEPAAVAAAQDALAEGGTAADAAVALYFTLSVTLPSVASLGGGGVCLAHNPATGRTDMLDFIAAASGPSAAGTGPFPPVPGNVRGMAALHARLGRLPWRYLLANAATLARSGNFVSKPFAKDLREAAGTLFADAAARRLFTTRNGAPLAAGEPIRQVALGSVLALLRARGAGAFYMGEFADRLVEGIRRSGSALTKQTLRNFVPRWRPALTVEFDGGRLHVAGWPTRSGLQAAQIWRMLTVDRRYAKASADERPRLLAEFARRVRGEAPPWNGANGDIAARAAKLLSADNARRLIDAYDPGPPIETAAMQDDSGLGSAAGSASGFLVVDGSGMAVACTVTLNNPFGTGRLLPDIGIFAAAGPGFGQHSPTMLAPVLATGQDPRRIKFAASAVGGAGLPAALAGVAARSLIDKMPLRAALEKLRAETPNAGAPYRRPGDRISVVNCPAGVPQESPRFIDCTAEAGRSDGLDIRFLLEKD